MAQIPEQIDIMINNECNARCGFCVQEATYKALSEDNATFLAGVQKHVSDYVSLGGKRIIVTGGEPTLRPEQLEQVLHFLAQVGDLEFVTMYTNGSQLLRTREGESIAQRLRDRGLSCVNHSVHHFDANKNRAVFRISGIPNPADVATHLRTIGLPFRYCATIQKGGLENTKDLVGYLKFAEENGAKDVYFRELFQIDPESASKMGPVEYTRQHFIPVDSLVSQLKSAGCIEAGQRSQFQGRQKNEIGMTTKTGFPFFVSTLRIGKEQSEKLPYLVVMPDGHLYTTWCGTKFRIPSLKSQIYAGGLL